MSNILSNVFEFLFGSNSWLGTIVISMCPLVELKGGIPVGMSNDFWGEFALSNIQAFLFALIGSSIIIFILPKIFKPILNFLKRTKLFKWLGNYIDDKVKKQSDNILNKKNNTILKWWAIFVFVAIPLPLTGVWTGACVSVAIGLDYWQTVSSVFFGNVVAGLLIFFVCSIFPSFTTWIFYGVLIIMVCVLTNIIIKKLIEKRRQLKDK